ncbi:hypothetical protein [Spirosoma rhododendri]|uniref:Uncharacterized protein n=1 Tax=Spirosoma rhododendri TaxID=2728024 RepID=A0A7L5DNB0_9BACT|nr:hypothetical protein [Spirosoma rhododendri]QJD77537.1 hypothetical protein HH216_03230 [Spirosoma rhododendri]
MQVQIDIGFSQLVQIVKALPPTQLKQLRVAIDEEIQAERPPTNLETLLLSGPVATEEEIAVIESNRKAINQWRIK